MEAEFGSLAFQRNVSSSSGLSFYECIKTLLTNFKSTFQVGASIRIGAILAKENQKPYITFSSLAKTFQKVWNKVGSLIHWQNTHDNVNCLCKEICSINQMNKRGAITFNFFVTCIIVVNLVGKKSQNLQRKGKIHMWDLGWCLCSHGSFWSTRSSFLLITITILLFSPFRHLYRAYLLALLLVFFCFLYYLSWLLMKQEW